MPNWSYNSLKVSGTKEEMEKFYQIALKMDESGKEVFSFNNLFPMPEKIRNTISPSSSALGRKWINEDVSSKRNDKLSDVLGEDENHPDLIPVENNTPEKCQQLIKEFGTDNWYDWNIKNYGTKWNATDTDFTKEETEFHSNFDTAWSPPSTFIEKLVKMFPNLDIKLVYDLEGSNDCGILYSEDGEMYFQEGELEYLDSNGNEVFYDNNDGNWCVKGSTEPCEDYYSQNPFSLD